MPATLSELELSDLDFTDTVLTHASGISQTGDPTERILQQLDAVVDAMALQIEFGSRDERLWRVLAGVYMAMERVTDYSDLVRKHLATFGRALKLDQPGITFALPLKVNFDDIPKLDMIRGACALPGGATLDFSAVRRVSAGGMIALTELLLALVPVDVVPHLRGVEGFVGSVEAAIKSGQGTSEAQELIAAYRCFTEAHFKRPEQGIAAA